MKVADTILRQLGGNKFIAMTGSCNFIADGNTLRMTLRKNKSGANRLFITLVPGSDTYNMKFYKVTSERIDKITLAFTEGKVVLIDEYDDVFWEDLQNIFTRVTGLHTQL